MNLAKKAGLVSVVAGGLTNTDILFIISILLTVLGMLQTYLENRKNGL